MLFLHSADWQLGMTRHFLKGEAQARFTADRQEAIAEIGSVAENTGAEFVVVAGDVFEHNQLSPQVVSRSLDAMRKIGVPVYLLPGNHDPLDATTIYRSPHFLASKPDHVHVLTEPGVHVVRPGVEIVAVPWTSKAPTTDVVAEVLATLSPSDAFRVLLAHGGVDILDPDPTKRSLIRMDAVRSALNDGLIHYVALGDKHSRTQVGECGRIWYSGSQEVTNYDDIEADPGHVLAVELGDGGARVAPHRVGRWRFVTLDRDVNNSRDVTDLGLNLDLLEDKHRTVVRLKLRGTLTITEKAQLDECLDTYSHRFASLRLWERHTDIAIAPDEGEFDDLGIGGFAREALDELLDTAAGDSDAQSALSLLFRLAGGSAA